MTEVESPPPFLPGVEVAFVQDRWGFSMRRIRVAKVHKTGRFTVEGSDQQYTPTRYLDGRWVAKPTVRDAYSAVRIELITPELEAREAHARILSRVTAGLRKLEQIDGDRVTPSDAEVIESLAERIARK